MLTASAAFSLFARRRQLRILRSATFLEGHLSNLVEPKVVWHAGAM